LRQAAPSSGDFGTAQVSMLQVKNNRYRKMR
jgi:hypothetical protein